jgi:orotidine-5'-phosphate decarboxylase
MPNFFERVALIQEASNSLLCVGLDPEIGRFPAAIRKGAEPIFTFNKAIIDATADLVCCYKPQIAHYAGAGAEGALEKTIAYIHDKQLPVLLDAKRGDVSSTAAHYARELFERYGADAATINPYLGFDAMEPYIEYRERGVFILCRTSNPGGADIQNLQLANGKQLYEHVAEQAATRWNKYRNVGLVVGATQPGEVKRIRELVGPMTLLLPGIGAQGGEVAATVEAGAGGGMILSASRSILYASSGPDFAECARAVAEATRNEINACRA